MHQLTSTYVILGILVSRVACINPLQMTWNTGDYFGPDGPWQGVAIFVGDHNPPLIDGDPLTVYPGGAWDSVFLTKEVCNGNKTGCLASKAGVYDSSKSATANYDVQLVPSLGEWGSDTAMNITGEKEIILDTFTFQSKQTNYHIPNFVFAAANSSNALLPNGNSYSTEVGLLALGAPHTSQQFSEGNGSYITGNVLTGFLKLNGSIPSSSWGLHIGSVMQGQEGSLILGGYDQSRALGTVGSFDLAGDTGSDPTVPLIDISIGVQTGGSPFKSSTIEGLFQFGQNTSAPMTLNPALPYMFLPQETCDAIARNLPVTYQSSSGLYTWNTNDPQYLRIVSSPAYIQFTFQQSASTNMSIKVPFPLFNLTLGSPIINSPTPYFPCKPYDTPDGNYYLGRAFLQAAFLGANWESGKFFLAQAPGPNSGPSQITNIQSADTIISSHTIDTFTDSWSQKWTALPLPLGSSNLTANATGTPTSNTTSAQSTQSSGLSTGAKAGIGVGIAAVVLITLAALAICLFRRRRRQQDIGPQSQSQQQGPEPPHQQLRPHHELPTGAAEHYRSDYKERYPIETYQQPYHRVHELDAPVVIHETGDGSLPEMSADRNSRSFVSSPG